MTLPVIGFAGMTHLGLNSAAAAAEKGFSVVCFHPDSELCIRLMAGNLPVNEPGLTELVVKNPDRLHFTSEIGDLKKCDVVYVAPDVATDGQGRSDLGYVSELIAEIDAVLRDDCVMVVLSQVPPGFTRSLQRRDVATYYQVETLIFGRAVERALFPERFIIGCADPHAALPDRYAAFLESFGCPILPMRYESAELAKISINCCLVATICVANTLAELCENIGADWSEIVPALKLDERIGAYAYLSPGLGIAGGNLERDLATVCNLASANGTDDKVVRAWISNSRYRRDWVLRTLHREIIAENPEPVIAVWGLAYKQDTHSTKNSPSLALIEALNPYSIQAYDPVVSVEVVSHPHTIGAASELEACTGADVLMIMTPWTQFSKIDPNRVASSLRGKTIIDAYAVLDATACQNAGLHHITLGAPLDPPGVSQ
jgi:UDPglucose 6-dehydrogenase